MAIAQERLEREDGQDLVVTAPSVADQAADQGRGNRDPLAADLPEPAPTEEVREPWMEVQAIMPTDDLGTLMELFRRKRSESLLTETLIRAGSGSRSRCRWRRR